MDMCNRAAFLDRRANISVQMTDGADEIAHRASPFGSSVLLSGFRNRMLADPSPSTCTSKQLKLSTF